MPSVFWIEDAGGSKLWSEPGDDFNPWVPELTSDEGTVFAALPPSTRRFWIFTRRADGRAEPAAGIYVDLSEKLASRLVVASGRVVDRDSHQPVAGANVRIENGGQPRGSITDSAGAFRILAAPGASSLSVQDKYHQPLERPVQVGDGGALVLGDVVVSEPAPSTGQIGVWLRLATGSDQTAPFPRSGVAIDRVIAKGPATKAGLSAGDVILSVDGRAVNDIQEAQARIRGEPATPVELAVNRRGACRKVRVIRAK